MVNNDFQLDEDFQELDDALERLEDELENAEIYVDSSRKAEIREARDTVERLRGKYGHLEEEVKLSREWIDEVRQAEGHYHSEYLQSIDDILQNLKVATEQTGYQPSSRKRRGFLKWLALIPAGFVTAFAANELADEYDVDIVFFPRSGDYDRSADNDSGELNHALEMGEYELAVVEEFDDENEFISKIADRYRSFEGEIGHLGGQIRHEYGDTAYRDLILGYDDETQYVQMRTVGNELLVNFSFDADRQYSIAKQEARDVEG